MQRQVRQDPLSVQFQPLCGAAAAENATGESACQEDKIERAHCEGFQAL